MDRRAVLAGAGTIAGALAGCLSRSTVADPHRRTFQTTTAALEAPESPTSPAIGEDAFSTFVGTMRHDRVYGDAGIWGFAEEPPDDGPAFVGALTEGLRSVGEDIASQHAFAVYALDEPGPRRRHQCWCWSGVDVSEVGERLADIAIEFDAQAEGITVGAYAPVGAVDADGTDRYDIDLTHTIGDDGISTAFPLPDGRVAVDRDESSMGPGGAVKMRWSGTVEDRYALGMTCVAQWDTGATSEIDWRIEATFA